MTSGQLLRSIASETVRLRMTRGTAKRLRESLLTTISMLRGIGAVSRDPSIVAADLRDLCAITCALEDLADGSEESGETEVR